MRTRIALLGASLALDSIAAALTEVPDIELRRICGTLENIWGDGRAPDALIFDIATGLPDFVLLNLVDKPELVLLGFDLETHQMLLLSGEPGRLTTMNDLLTMLSLQHARLVKEVGHGNGLEH
jgi:hypothetical protein